MTTWSGLGRAAKAFRVAHVLWGFAGIASLGYVWICAFMRRRDRVLKASAAFLSLEGLALVIGRGDCPLGPFQRKLGDPVPMFELVLPPRAAKAAVPVLVLVTSAGFAAVLVRGRADAVRTPQSTWAATRARLRRGPTSAAR